MVTINIQILPNNLQMLFGKFNFCISEIKWQPCYFNMKKLWLFKKYHFHPSSICAFDLDELMSILSSQINLQLKAAPGNVLIILIRDNEIVDFT